MAILNWRDHPRLRFVDFPPPFLTKGSVFIASDKGDTAWISDGTAYLQLYPTATTAQDLGVMTWAEKPAPNSVPAGTRFTASDFLMSDWQTLNGYWTPVGGRAVVYSPDTTGVQVQSATSQPVAGIPGWTLPADLVNVPSIYVEGRVICDITAPSNLQQRQIYIGVEGATAVVARHLYTSVPIVKKVFGRADRQHSTSWVANLANSSLMMDGNGGGDASAAQMTSSPIRIYYQGGNTDGSEVLNIRAFSLAVGIG